MTKIGRTIKALLVCFSCACFGSCISIEQSSAAEIYIVMPESSDVELSEQERLSLAVEAANLIADPSDVLLDSISAENGVAWLIDQRDEPDALHALSITITYPMVIVGNTHRYEPRIQCEGSFSPLVWSSCQEASNLWLRVGGYDFVRVNHESITLDNMPEMFATLDSAKLESPTGASIESTGVHHILFNSRTGLFHLIGGTGNGEQFFAYLRPIDGESDTNYVVADWTCQ